MVLSMVLHAFPVLLAGPFLSIPSRCVGVIMRLVRETLRHIMGRHAFCTISVIGGVFDAAPPLLAPPVDPPQSHRHKRSEMKGQLSREQLDSGI